MQRSNEIATSLFFACVFHMCSSFLVRHTTAGLFCALWQQPSAAMHAPCWSLHARAKMATDNTMVHHYSWTPPHPTPPHPTPRCRASARCVMSGFCSLCDVGGPSGNKGLRTQLCGWGWGWGRGWGELKPTWVLGANMCVCVFHYQAWFSHLLEHKSAPDCTNQPKRIHESPNLNKSKEI